MNAAPRTPVTLRVGSVLLLDASGERLWAGLASSDGAVRLSRTAPAPTGRTRALGFARLVHRVMDLASSRITGIAAAVGPSTPGGIRLSVTVANALAWALNLPVAAYDSAGDGKVVHFGRWQAAGTLRPRYIHGPNITEPR